MSAVDDLADYLETAGHGTIGTDIFKDRMPPSPENCTVLYEYGGERPELVGSVEYPLIQVKTRGSDRDTALTRIYDARDTLHLLHNEQINGVTYLFAQAIDSPAFLGYDRQGDQGCPVFGMNFKVVRIWP